MGHDSILSSWKKNSADFSCSHILGRVIVPSVRCQMVSACQNDSLTPTLTVIYNNGKGIQIMKVSLRQYITRGAIKLYHYTINSY